MISVVIPVYGNEANIASLLQALQALDQQLAGEVEAVFVVDGSPDQSHARLSLALPNAAFRSQLLLLSRNFGSFAAIRAGLAAGRGERFSVLAADLQEPIELVATFDEKLRRGECDIAVGQRTARKDPLPSRLAASVFWGLFRRFVIPDLPPGGVDVFACTRRVRDELVRLAESNSSLVGLLFWVGFTRVFVPYERKPRAAGRSAWTLARKLRYLSDSVFSFSDLPIQVMTRVGILGIVTSLVFAAVVLAVKLFGSIPVPGYAATILVVTFFGALNCFGIGVLGGYVWRMFQNTKGRPLFLVDEHRVFEGRQKKDRDDSPILSSAGPGRD